MLFVRNHSLRRIVSATTKALWKRPKQVLQYAALRVLDADGDMSALLDGIYSLDQRLLPMLQDDSNYDVIRRIYEKTSNAASKIQWAGWRGAATLEKAYEERPKDVIKEDLEWLYQNVEPSWNGPGDWGVSV